MSRVMKTSMRAPSWAASVPFLNGVLALAGMRFDRIVCGDNRDLIHYEELRT